jgi:quinol monooxygenase YgiN
MTDFFIVAVLYSKQGKEKQLRADLTAVVEPSRRDEGNLGYDLFVDQSDGRRFVFVEHWQDSASQEKHHNETNHIRHFQAHGSSAVEKIEFYKLDRIA